MLPGSIWQTYMNAAVRGTPAEQFSPFVPLGVPPGLAPTQSGDSEDCKSDDSDDNDDDCDAKDSDTKSDADSDKKSDDDSDKKKRDEDSDSRGGDSDRSDRGRDGSDSSDDSDSSDEGAAFTPGLDRRFDLPSGQEDSLPVVRAAHSRPAPGE
jgi:membrane peptidoglycan carboxypeptidase